MIIVAGYLIVDAGKRAAYLQTCVEVIAQARRASGCLDFSLTADLLDETRVNVFERWESRAQVEAFRGSGPSDEQNAMIRGASVAEYDVVG
jgi:quinol monooxygenase YgiN